MKLRLLAVAALVAAGPTVWASSLRCRQNLTDVSSNAPVMTPAERLFARETAGDPKRSTFTIKTMVARAAIHHIANARDMTAREKADFWSEVVALISARISTFTSEPFEGSGGAIVFQGDFSGIALVIDRDGVVWRGDLHPILNHLAQPRPIWIEDYDKFLRISPAWAR